jgi:hypothetical protein
MLLLHLLAFKTLLNAVAQATSFLFVANNEPIPVKMTTILKSPSTSVCTRSAFKESASTDVGTGSAIPLEGYVIASSLFAKCLLPRANA